MTLRVSFPTGAPSENGFPDNHGWVTLSLAFDEPCSTMTCSTQMSQWEMVACMSSKSCVWCAHFFLCTHTHSIRARCAYHLHCLNLGGSMVQAWKHENIHNSLTNRGENTAIWAKKKCHLRATCAYFASIYAHIARKLVHRGPINVPPRVWNTQLGHGQVCLSIRGDSPGMRDM